MPSSAEELREEVRQRYAESARAVSEEPKRDCASAACCSDDSAATAVGSTKFGEVLYDLQQRDELPDAAALASLGCGNPTAVADLHQGDVVLDLGSGGGIDVILSAKRVGPTGTAYGLDMTDEMLALAQKNAAEAGVRNVHFLKGVIEAIPLPATSVDVIISNCVINLSTDKSAVLSEMARVIKPGGAGRSERRRGGGSPRSGGSCGSRVVRRLHRGCTLESRVRSRPQSGRFRAGHGRVHA